MIGIYKITNPKGKIYIGQSINIEIRLDQYAKLLNCKPQRKVYHSIVKYGWINHTAEAIHECLESDLNYWERFYQELHNSVELGLNLKYTQTEDRSGKMSLETRKLMSLQATGKKKSPEHVRKLKDRVSPMKGRKQTERHAASLILQHEKVKKSVLQFNLDGELLREWDSLGGIQKETGYIADTISLCCKGRKTSYKKSIWRFKKDCV